METVREQPLSSDTQTIFNSDLSVPENKMAFERWMSDHTLEPTANDPRSFLQKLDSVAPIIRTPVLSKLDLIAELDWD